MKHSWTRKNIIRFIDNDLNETERKEFEKHISACDSCNKDYKYIRSIIGSYEKSYSVPYSVWLKINSSIGKEEKYIHAVLPKYVVIRKFAFLFIVMISIIIGTFVGNKLLFNESKSNKIDLTEEYVPATAEMLETGISENGR